MLYLNLLKLCNIIVQPHRALICILVFFNKSYKDRENKSEISINKKEKEEQINNFNQIKSNLSLITLIWKFTAKLNCQVWNKKCK